MKVKCEGCANLLRKQKDDAWWCEEFGTTVEDDEITNEAECVFHWVEDEE